MSGAFQYKPKFVDIRVRPPKSEEEEAAKNDVNRLKPGEKRCDHPDCLSVATAKAPKSRDLPNDFYNFCQPHAAEYNKSWDYFAGMNEGQIRRAREDELTTGGRPTWAFKASPNSREAAAFAAKMGGQNTGGAGAYADPFGIFGAAKRRAQAEAETASRRLGKLERQALADLDLDDNADKEAIRARYLDLVKRCHPDANGGDRSAEHKLQRVIKAYKTLQKTGMA
ncbi:J domain-containing protein [Caulobacter sp. 17J65-9]|uniref:J domain-containing protein n=1 Tax=Caulobacter sp. 17J65-9 TaxID=2709382 RepID=UPI0013C869E9|nr:J domain-containing protein [Caulobacter sp. 17J65-9]NEX92029.1 J domain-containing protein [Caulobacter sp. 17J65-9]